MNEVKLSLVTSSPYRSHQVATVYGVPTQPTEDGLGQGWLYVQANLDCLDVTKEQQLELAELMVERFNNFTALREQMAKAIEERDVLRAQLAATSDHAGEAA